MATNSLYTSMKSCWIFPISPTFPRAFNSPCSFRSSSFPLLLLLLHFLCTQQRFTQTSKQIYTHVYVPIRMLNVYVLSISLWRHSHRVTGLFLSCYFVSIMDSNSHDISFWVFSSQDECTFWFIDGITDIHCIFSTLTLYSLSHFASLFISIQ